MLCGFLIIALSIFAESGKGLDPLALGEVNGINPINAADIVYLVNYVFKSGPPPVGST